MNDRLNELSRLKTKSTEGWLVDSTYGSWQASPPAATKNCKNWIRLSDYMGEVDRV